MVPRSSNISTAAKAACRSRRTRRSASSFASANVVAFSLRVSKMPTVRPVPVVTTICNVKAMSDHTVVQDVRKERGSSARHLDVWSRNLVGRVGPEAFRLGSPSLADELVGREALEGLQTASEVVGGDEVGEVPLELVVVVVVVARTVASLMVRFIRST